MGFNNKQQEVINTINGPVMVVSCPGSGKTTVIVERANNMVKSGINEENILVITFTKASADEMKKRYIDKYGETNIHFGTIHHICLFILNKAYGISVDNIIKTNEQFHFISDMVKDIKIKKNDLDILIGNILNEISSIKNKNLDVEEFESDALLDPDEFRKIFKEYEKYKKENNMVDFDDILIMCKECLSNYPEILSFWQDQFKYLMIDEYQDTNVIQAEIFYMLADKHKNICVVGDDDQSIYGFRAADSSIMLNFEKEFPTCKKIFMDTNYRSRKEIIKYAGNLIQKNNVRFEKDFKAGREAGGKVKFRNMPIIEEIDTITEELLKAMHDGKNLSNYAILFRTNAQASNFVGKFIKEGIPFYAVDKFDNIHDSLIYQDILAYYRLANNCGKYGDFSKIVNKPTRYLKQAAFLNIDSLNDRPIMKVIDDYDFDANWKRKNARESLLDLIQSIKLLKDATPKSFFKRLESLIMYKKALKEYAEYTGLSYDDLNEVFSLLRNEAVQFDTMEDWIANVEKQNMLLQEMRNTKAQELKAKGVNLLTFHSSKGLEWDNVYIVDANEGMAPYKKAISAAEKAQSELPIEEERRLFYVAMTRAKENLHIFYDGNAKEPSRFINEAKK